MSAGAPIGAPTDTSTYEPDPEETRRAAEREVSGEIAGAVKPLEGQIPQIEADRAAAAQVLGELFGSAIQDSGASATRMRADYGQALQSEQAIMGAATTKLNDLRSQRAADAQKLAQQIGGYVPIGDFTSPVDLEASLFSAESAGSLLRATGLAEAGVQHAEAFTGRVLPLMRTREIAATNAAYGKEITRIRNEIATIKGQKSTLVNARTRERLLEDREWALKRATANREWDLAKKQAQLDRDTLKLKKEDLARMKKEGKGNEWVAKESLKLERERNRLAAIELYGTDVTYDKKTGTYKPVKGGAKTLAAKGLTADQVEAAAAAKAERRAYAFELVEAYINPGVEDISGTQWLPVQGPDSPGAVFLNGQWVRPVPVQQKIGRDPVTNPNVLYNLLIGQGIPKKLAQEVVQKQAARMGLPEDWVPGQAAGKPTETTAQERGEVSPRDTTTWTKAQLSDLSAPALIKIARKAGFEHKAPPGIQLWPPSYRKRRETDKEAKRTPAEKVEYTLRLREYWMLQILTRQAKRAGERSGPDEGTPRPPAKPRGK